MFDSSSNYNVVLTGSGDKKLHTLEVTPSVFKEIDDHFQNDSKKSLKIKDLKNKSHSIEMKLVTHLAYSNSGNEIIESPSTKVELPNFEESGHSHVHAPYNQEIVVGHTPKANEEFHEAMQFDRPKLLSSEVEDSGQLSFTSNNDDDEVSMSWDHETGAMQPTEDLLIRELRRDSDED